MACVLGHPGPQGEFLGLHDGRGGRRFRGEAHDTWRLHPGYEAVSEWDSQNLGIVMERMREAAVAKAARWTAAQAARLGMTTEAILEAIRRGPWLPEQIEAVESKYRLEDRPPELVGVEPWVDAAIEKRAKGRAA